jgi:hypothetical protein
VTEQPPQQATIRTARDLTAALTGLSARLDSVKADSETRDAALRRYGRRNRAYIVVDIILTVIVAAVTAVSAHAYDTASKASLSARQTALSASQLRAANITSCQAANGTRAQTIQLWDYILSLPAAPAPHETAAQKAARLKAKADFRAYVHRVFAPRDCEKTFGGK